MKKPHKYIFRSPLMTSTDWKNLLDPYILIYYHTSSEFNSPFYWSRVKYLNGE